MDLSTKKREISPTDNAPLNKANFDGTNKLTKLQNFDHEIKVWIKEEPIDPEENNESDIGEVNSLIKQEPPDPDESQEPSEDIPIYPVHVESVKVEPIHFGYGDDNASQDKESSEEEDSEEEYIPETEANNAKKKVKSDKNDKSSEKDPPEKDVNLEYSEDVMKLVTVYTLTEEERLQEYRNALESRKHMDFLCKFCALGFVLENAYEEHMKIHQQSFGVYECKLCHAWHKTTLSLKQHSLRHYRRYRCSVCGARYRDKDSAASHAMRAHAGHVLRCKHCNRGFKRPRYLKQHIEQYHNRTESIECTICKRIFYDKYMIRCHMRTHNKEVRAKKQQQRKVIINCPICSREYKNKTSLKKHLLSHEQNVPCDLCDEISVDRAALRKHYHRAHNRLFISTPKEETCPYCFRLCATGQMLKRHIERMHTDRTRKYQCDHCQRLFMTKSEVKSHIVWTHLPASIRGGHVCHCGKLFRSPSLLADHVNRRHRGHNPPRDHRCPCCGKGFMDKQVLNRHMKVHSEEMYPCKECGLEFKTKPYVDVHYKLKHLNMTRAEIKAEKRMNGKRIRENSRIQSSGNMTIDSDRSKPGQVDTVITPTKPSLDSDENGDTSSYASIGNESMIIKHYDIKLEPVDDLPSVPSDVH